jgi:hypothetical protein
MLKKEFENRFGQEVSDGDFEIINRMYMAAGEMDKDEFCKNFKMDFLSNPLIAALTVSGEHWIKAQMNTAEKLVKTEKELSELQRTVKGLENQVKSREERIGLLQAAVDATVTEVNLVVFPKLQERFNDLFGTSAVMRMRHSNGWDLSRDEIDWLLDHCEDYD